MADDRSAKSNSRIDSDIAEATLYLTEQGVPPGPNGYDEATLASVIHRNGWVYHFEGMTGAWRAIIRDAKTNTDTAAEHCDKVTTLLFAIEVALREQVAERFYWPRE